MKTAQANYTKIGENVYYVEYTTQVLNQIGIKADDSNDLSSNDSAIHNGILKVLRDYKHYVKITVTRENSKGEVKHYEGGSEYDPTVEAIKAFIRDEERKKKAQEAEREC